MTDRAYVVSAEELSVFQAGMPSAASITATLSSMTGEGIVTLLNLAVANGFAPTRATAATAADWGRWVGPQPRITRPAGVLGQRFVTQVTWVRQFGDTPFVAANAAEMAVALGQITDYLLGGVSSGWQPSVVTPFAAAVNGSLPWWESGQAAITQTRDIVPQGAGRLDPIENPIGPTTTQTHPGSILPNVSGPGGWLDTLKQVALWGGGIAVVVIAGPPLYRAVRDMEGTHALNAYRKQGAAAASRRTR